MIRPCVLPVATALPFASGFVLPKNDLTKFICSYKKYNLGDYKECKDYTWEKDPAISVCQITDVIGDPSGKNCKITRWLGVMCITNTQKIWVSLVF